MTFSDYVVTMEHDTGTIRIQTSASSAESAVNIVCGAEHAPRSAVKRVQVIPNLPGAKTPQDIVWSAETGWTDDGVTNVG